MNLFHLQHSHNIRDKLSFYDSSHFFLQQSTIKNAGIGVFTHVDWKKGQYVIPYGGEFITYPTSKELLWSRRCKGTDIFLNGLCLRQGLVRDGECYVFKNLDHSYRSILEQGIGFMVNSSPRVRDHNLSVKHIQINSILDYPIYIAKRDICSGEELFVRYGYMSSGFYDDFSRV